MGAQGLGQQVLDLTQAEVEATVRGHVQEVVRMCRVWLVCGWMGNGIVTIINARARPYT